MQGHSDRHEVLLGWAGSQQGIAVPFGRQAVPQPWGRALPKQSKSTSSESEADAAVQARAYQLWEADGRPHGRAEHYWHLAKAEAAPAKPKRKAPAKAPGAKAPEKTLAKKAKA